MATRLESFEQIQQIEQLANKFSHTWPGTNNQKSIHAWGVGARHFLLKNGLLCPDSFCEIAHEKFTSEECPCFEYDYYQIGYEGFVAICVEMMSEGSPSHRKTHTIAQTTAQLLELAISLEQLL